MRNKSDPNPNQACGRMPTQKKKKKKKCDHYVLQLTEYRLFRHAGNPLSWPLREKSQGLCLGTRPDTSKHPSPHFLTHPLICEGCSKFRYFSDPEKPPFFSQR